jgi:DNA-binding transcriptional regulator YiaG
MDNYTVKTQEVNTTVRGLNITTELDVAYDENNEEVYVREIEIKNDIKLYDIYKEKNGLLTSKQVKAIREYHNFPQKHFAKLLGLEELSIYKYENGTIQSEIDDKKIRGYDAR